MSTRHPLRDLLARYRAIFQHAWAHRTELAGPTRLASELAFLPAALSLQDTPVHPAPRRLAWGDDDSLCAGAPVVHPRPCGHCGGSAGRIIVSDRTKVIQPLEASVVKAVLVKDGDRVG